jgi:transcriptional regulator with XRE-family HTH domain
MVGTQVAHVRTSRKNPQSTRTYASNAMRVGDPLGVTRGAVANWESANAALPATKRLQRIAHATGSTSNGLLLAVVVLATKRRGTKFRALASKL